MDRQVEDGAGLGELSALSAVVGEEARAAAAAAAVVLKTEGEVLAAAIEVMRPSLAAICTGTIWREHGDTSGRNGLNPVEVRDAFPERGLLLVDGYERSGDGTGNRGALTGHRLYLLADGTFAEVERDGSWSHWQGEWDRYEATMRRLDPAAVALSYDLDDVVEALRDAVRRVADGRLTRAKAASEARAQQLARAVAALRPETDGGAA